MISVSDAEAGEAGRHSKQADAAKCTLIHLLCSVLGSLLKACFANRVIHGRVHGRGQKKVTEVIKL